MKQESVISNLLLKHAFIYKTVDVKIRHLANSDFVNQMLQFKRLQFIHFVLVLF